MKDAFEHSFREAIQKSLACSTAPDEVRSRLLARLNESTRDPSPVGVDEQACTLFQGRLSEATHRSQDWAPEDSVVLKTEAALSKEMGRDCLSERAVGAALDGSQDSVEMVDQSKLKFVQAVRQEVKRSSGELKAPAEVRQRVMSRLKSEPGSAPRKVLPFPTAAQWRRGMSALATLAAGFVVVFVTLFGSADVALANTVRRDHQNCCRMALMTNGKKCKPKAVLEKEFGPIPTSPLDPSWKLILAQECHGEEGQKMVHMLYVRDKKGGGKETLSLHYFPDPGHKGASLDLKEKSPTMLTDEGFPVLGWLDGNWVCTACSPDLSSAQLAKQLNS